MTPQEIKQIRLSLGLTQEKFAQRLGVSFCTVNNWERGRQKPQNLSMLALKAAKKSGDKNGKKEDDRPGHLDQ